MGVTFPSINCLSFTTIYILGGRLALIHVCACDGEVTSNGPTVIATYVLLYKVWESMAKDNIITEVN